MSKIKKEKLIAKREKIGKFHKIKLIYLSKLKSNVIRQDIRRKKYNLTQNHARNDPIDC